MERKTRGFTLIELLVVIAIIAILAAILFPVFTRAKKNAQLSTCTNNMKQWGMAVLRYTDDHNGRYPYAGASGYQTCDTYHAPKPQGKGGSPIVFDALKKYTANSEKLKWCPLFEGAFKPWMAECKWSYWYYCGHGHGNAAGWPDWQLCGYTTSDVSAPSRKPLIGEIFANHSFDGYAYGFDRPDIKAPASLVYCDGHVTTRMLNYEDQCRYTYATRGGILPPHQ